VAEEKQLPLDQVQTFMPTPMAMATTMYHTRKNPLRKVTADSEVVETARSGKIRRTHKPSCATRTRPTGLSCAKRWSTWAVAT
jgi:radical SAM superfamily enzyme YgiQ (UPF0313 family)